MECLEPSSEIAIANTELSGWSSGAKAWLEWPFRAPDWTDQQYEAMLRWGFAETIRGMA